MSRVFADTHFYIAILSRHDVDHERATRLAREGQFQQVVTTWGVLLELADGMCGVTERQRVTRFIAQLQRTARNKIVGLSDSLIERGLSLYRARPDKEWSLTDCISLVVMEDQGLREVLTHDHHFTQAGHVALLARA